ncbi:membrane carboxypeptidase/penicillin-binding protein [Bradyrhizobium sp. YR681]|uniref:transglycosylase domain-containing protein n=1 Tax=Bradyrhizobium sp. YR681 TaxID=1144344 RepID=UPI000271419E|nr:transglycosylase domain-containing protein [Bradyrhizobium sp. YR681]EJN11544.1 membrane carboxypeptidase/penicillin-binding protein [Bradyrhizobium sp. YR681]
MRKFLVVVAKAMLALLSLVGVGLLALSAWLVWHYGYGIGLPTEAQLAAVSPTGPSCRSDPRRATIPLADIPLLLRNAVIAYQQPNFYDAWTLNPVAEIASGLITGRRTRPAGITQSVAQCLVLLSPGNDRQIDPIATIYFMQRVTRSLSRDRILEIYLNESYLGRSAYGVAAGAEAYFGKTLAELEIDEVAFILTRARWPYPGRTFDTRTRDHAIDRMQTAGLIGETQAAAAKSRPLLLKEAPGTQARPVNP